MTALVAVPGNVFVGCRRAKAALLSEDLPALEKLVKKGKKITPEMINDRASKVSLLQPCKHCRLAQLSVQTAAVISGSRIGLRRSKCCDAHR